MTGDVLAILDELATALKEGGTERALALLDDLATAYDQKETRERARIEKAKQITRNNIGDEPDAVRSFLEQTTVAQMNRAGAVIALRTSLTYPERSDENLTELVTTLIEREQSVADAAAASEDRLAEISLSAFPFLQDVGTPDGPVGKGTTVELSSTVLNIGDKPATGLAPSISLGEGLVLVDGPNGDTEIGPGAAVDVSAKLRAEAAGDFTITVEVTGDPERDAVETDQVEVLDKGAFVERAQRQVAQLRTRVRDLNPPSGGRQRQLVAKLDAALDRLEEAERYVERSEKKEADNMLKAASRQLGAFINALEADGNGRKGNLSEGRRISFVEAASDSIDLLAEAEASEI